MGRVVGLGRFNIKTKALRVCLLRADHFIPSDPYGMALALSIAEYQRKPLAPEEIFVYAEVHLGVIEKVEAYRLEKGVQYEYPHIASYWQGRAVPMGKQA